MLYSLETLRPSQSEAFVAVLRSGRNFSEGIHRGSGLGSGYDARWTSLNFLDHFLDLSKVPGTQQTCLLVGCFPTTLRVSLFSAFILSKILSRLTKGAFRVWEEVGSDEPTHLVMPLTVEPSKCP